MKKYFHLNKFYFVTVFLLIGFSMGFFVMAKNQPSSTTILIKDVPHIKQKPDFCGEACVAMYLQKLGYDVNQDYVFDQSGLNPKEGRGCYTKELKVAIEEIGFESGDVWHKVKAGSADEIEKHWQTIESKLSKNIPVIACMHYDESPKTTEHFRLILGFDEKKQEVIYHEPAEKNGTYRRMKKKEFLKLWPLKYESKRWTLIYFPLDPKAIKLQNDSKEKYSSADYAQKVQEIKKKLPDDSFSICIEPPFVVIGDAGEKRIKSISDKTVAWAVKMLKQEYFDSDPDEILEVWLFKDKQSYNKNTYKVFQDKPTTPYGYYSSHHGALIMNIATGGGTLVHEIVHPFIEANFPDCPSWLNEGLGSLYEQCGEKNGKINGFTNWRLKNLQSLIKEKSLPTFEDLCLSSSYEFYNGDEGDNYAQARYLCYYLQEKKLLNKFYKQFVKNQKEDPTGYRTLQIVLGKPDMEKFQNKWEKWVLKLKYR